MEYCVHSLPSLLAKCYIFLILLPGSLRSENVCTTVCSNLLWLYSFLCCSLQPSLMRTYSFFTSKTLSYFTAYGFLCFETYCLFREKKYRHSLCAFCITGFHSTCLTILPFKSEQFWITLVHSRAWSIAQEVQGHCVKSYIRTRR